MKFLPFLQLKKLQKSNRGQTALEFSITLLAFLVVLFAIGDMLLITHNWLGIQFASNRGIRQTKMLPTSMRASDKAAAIQNQIAATALSLGIDLEKDNIVVHINGNNISAETQKDVQVSPVTGLLLAFGGDHSGTYHLRVREAVRNESL